MEENKENIIKYHQNKRKKHKIKLAITAIILTLIGLVLIGIYYFLNKRDFIIYRETSDIKYGVNLKENEFYEENYLEEGIDVIANLIKNIDAEFKYNLELDEEIEYKYSYKILAEIAVKEKQKTNLLYKTEQELLNKTQQEAKSNKLEILEKINVDYNEYNNQINKLLDVYKLSNTTSELHLNLYLSVINKQNGDKINKEDKVATITIPLTTTTVEITINENIKDHQGKIWIYEEQYKYLEYILPVGVLILIIGLIIFARLTKYILDTRSAEKMYEDELNKILFDYKSYIQKINNKIYHYEYKVIKVDTFKELLSMREELQSPILMYTELNDRRTTFMIINGDILFEYILEARLIRENLIKKSKEKAEKKNEKNK